MDPTLKVAKKYPNVHFEHATGFKHDKNMGIYNGRFYEGRYVQGLIAGKMSKAGVLGYIGSFPIPEVIMGMNATMIAAQSVNPNIKVKIIWANTWFDPGKEADAAKALLDQGADVIMQHTDSPAAMQIASERGKLAFGQDSEMIKFGPKTQLTSIIDNWAPYYISRVKAEMDGKWATDNVWDGLKAKMVVMAPYTNMPDDVKKLAMDTEAAIIAGKLMPFKCPIVDQDGKTILTRLQSARRRAVAVDQIGHVETGDGAVDDGPFPRYHHAIGAMGAAQHQRRQRIAMTRKTKLIELEQREIGSLADGDLT
jgi:simple sugar transport system substrate-binding protein